MSRHLDSFLDSEIMWKLTLKPVLLKIDTLMGDYTRGSISVERERMFHLDKMMLQLRAFILGKKVEEIPKEWIEYPRDWWQAFKQRFFPKWLLKRYPVKMEKKVVRLEVFHLCPHINVPFKGDRSDPHITFLMRPSLWPMPEEVIE